MAIPESHRESNGTPLMRHPKKDFAALLRNINQNVPFSFIRFSDGEYFMLRRAPFRLSENGFHFAGRHRHDMSYAPFDKKTFDPDRGAAAIHDLETAARLQSHNFFKGVMASHNVPIEARDYFVSMNGGSEINLTFADLLINNNYRKFINAFVPALLRRRHIFLVGNFRMQPELVSSRIGHIRVPDDFLAHDYILTRDKIVEELSQVPDSSVVLLAASCLSNAVALKLASSRNDLTLLDVGTALHPQMGLGVVRAYHDEILPWRISTAVPKLRLRLSRRNRMRW